MGNSMRRKEPIDATRFYCENSRDNHGCNKHDSTSTRSNR